MQIFTSLRALCLAAVACTGPVVAGLVEDYESYPGETARAGIEVTVDGTPVFVHDHPSGGIAYVHFSFSGSVEIAVTAPVMDDRVRPLKLGIAATRTGNTLRFTIDNPFNYVVLEYDNGTKEKSPLVAILAETPMADQPTLGSAGVHSATTAYGISAGGTVVETQKINDAITAISNAGGGTLFFEKGVYRSGTIEMKDNVQLWVDAGARIMGSNSGTDFPALGSRNLARFAHSAQVFWDHTRNGKIRGHGIIDGNDGGVVDGNDTHFMLFAAAKNSIVEGINVMNSRSWTMHPVECDTVIFRNVHVFNRHGCCYVDQFDIDASRDVLLDNCFAYGGDDATTIKAVVNDRTVMRNITVRNSTLWSTSSEGLRVCGAQMEANWSSCTNVLYDNVHFVYSGQNAMRFEMCGSGISDNWQFLNCSIEGRGSEAMLGSPSHCWNASECASPGTVSNFVFQNLDIYGTNTFPTMLLWLGSADTDNAPLYQCVRTDGVVQTGDFTWNQTFTPCDATPSRMDTSPSTAPSTTSRVRRISRGAEITIAAPGSHTVTILSVSGAVVRCYRGSSPATYTIGDSGRGRRVYLVSAEVNGETILQTVVCR